MRRKFLIAFVVLLAIVPQLPVPEFWITQLNYIGMYTLVVLGLVLLTGIAGLTSFGQAAFVGLGAMRQQRRHRRLGPVDGALRTEVERLAIRLGVRVPELADESSGSSPTCSSEGPGPSRSTVFVVARRLWVPSRSRSVNCCETAPQVSAKSAPGFQSSASAMGSPGAPNHVS